MNMFEQVSRMKLRFKTSKGDLTVEDLWDLRLTGTVSLNTLAKSLNKQLKLDDEEDFVSTKSASNKVLELKFELVKHIIGVKKAEQEAAANAADVKAKKQKLAELIAKKQDSALEGKSLEELQAELNALG